MSAVVGAALLFIVGAVSAEAQSSKRENGVSRARAARAERAKATVSSSAAGTLANASANANAAAKPAPAESAPRFESVIRAMNDAPALGNRFVRLRMLAPEQIELVDVRNVFRERAEQERFEAAVAEHDRAITALRSTLQNSITLRDLLYDRQLAMSQVVAVDILPDGKHAVVYYRTE